MATKLFLAAAAVLLVFPLLLQAQQTDIERLDLYSGFTYFSSPSLNLAEHGYHLQAGYNTSRLLTLGFDYSIVTGHNSLTPDLLTQSLQLQVATALKDLALAGLLPPGYQLSVPTDSTTETFAAGTQFSYRHFVPVTLFIRPDLGAIREEATPRPRDPIAVLIVQQLAPAGHKISWASFYGFGGGMDWNFSRNLALRLQADQVYNHLFNDLLKDSRWTTRASIGLAFRFGGNILEGKSAPAKP